MNRRHFLRHTGLATAGLAGWPRTGMGQAGARKPNIVLIFTDDQGYQDVGCFGSKSIQTPHLDRMAEEGLRMTDFYSASPVCSPSRAALLTGCYPTRVGIPRVLFPNQSIGLNPEELTTAKVLKQQGYATACIGKWHLGHLPDFLPMRHGFDSYYGIPYSNDMWIDPRARLAAGIRLLDGATQADVARASRENSKNKVPLMRGEEVIEYPCDQRTLTQRYTEEAMRFIREHRNRPFFLYLPHTMPHIPLFVSDDFKARSRGRLYDAVIEEIDWSVGEILRLLKELGIDENTLVIFTSDNGPWLQVKPAAGSAGPLRDGKHSTYEGGMRVPFIARWPGRIPAGSVSGEVAATIDLFPTFAALVGARIPPGRVTDGKDIRPLLFGEPGARSPHEAFYYYRNNDVQAVRMGRWKFRRGGPNAPLELYDLENDIGEKTNLAQKEPQRAQRMLKQMQDFDRTLKSQTRPAGKVGP
jgi:arylsulfatase A